MLTSLIVHTDFSTFSVLGLSTNHCVFFYLVVPLQTAIVSLRRILIPLPFCNAIAPIFLSFHVL